MATLPAPPVSRLASPAHQPVADGVSATGLRPFVVYGVGTLLLIVNAYFGTYAYVVVQALLWTQTSLQRGPIVLLFLLALINFALARVARRVALTRQELLLLYAMLCVGTCVGGYGFVQQLINQIGAPFYFANGGNHFAERILPNVPTWLAPHDPAVYTGFFRGNSSLYTATVLRGWLVPVLSWSAFIVAIFWVLLCATALLRRSWIEEERLTFPLVLLPLEMTDTGLSATDGVPFWKNRWMWAGFLIAGLLESTNFLNFLYPSIPSLPIKPSMGPNHLEQFLTTRPWNAVGVLTLAFYPSVIGIGYLLSLDVSFSCWFLYLMGKVASIFCSAIGLSDSGAGGAANRAPYLREQGIGAFVGVALFSGYLARRQLKIAWQSLDQPTTEDRDELMSYRTAILGGGAGLLFLIAFLIAAGLSPFLSVLFVVAYMLIAITLGRIVSEAGAGWAWAPNWSPAAFTGDAIGTTNLSPRELTMLIGYLSWTSDMRDNPLPQTMAGMKMAQGGGLSARAYLKPLLFATVLGVLVAFWAHLDIYYTYGSATAKVRPAISGMSATGAARQAASLISTPTPPDSAGLLAALAGTAIVIAFFLLRQQFPWWPLHPLGYALATTSSMEYMWCPFFLAWLAKLITLRYGGIRAYRAALPFFLGLILGDYVVPALWGIFGMLTGYQQYMAFPH
jgi:hypothetical protein